MRECFVSCDQPRSEHILAECRPDVKRWQALPDQDAPLFRRKELELATATLVNNVRQNSQSRTILSKSAEQL